MDHESSAGDGGNAIEIRKLSAQHYPQLLPEENISVAPTKESEEALQCSRAVVAEPCVPQLQQRRRWRPMLPLRRSGVIPCEETNTVISEKRIQHNDFMNRDDITDTPGRLTKSGIHKSLAPERTVRHSLSKKRPSGVS